MLPHARRVIFVNENAQNTAANRGTEFIATSITSNALAVTRDRLATALAENAVRKLV